MRPSAPDKNALYGELPDVDAQIMGLAFGILRPGYVLGILVLTPGYQLVQTANHTAALADVAKERRGAVG